MRHELRIACAVLLGAALTSCNCGPHVQDLAGTWTYRYSCGTTAQCFEHDECGTITLVPDALELNRFLSSTQALSGLLEGTVFRWKARWGTPAYDEVGTWTFSEDFSAFTQETCFAFDGTVDETTSTCRGRSQGWCRGAGARSAPVAPAAVGACPASTRASTCPSTTARAPGDG